MMSPCHPTFFKAVVVFRGLLGWLCISELMFFYFLTRKASTPSHRKLFQVLGEVQCELALMFSFKKSPRVKSSLKETVRNAIANRPLIVDRKPSLLVTRASVKPSVWSSLAKTQFQLTSPSPLSGASSNSDNNSPARRKTVVLSRILCQNVLKA